MTKKQSDLFIHLVSVLPSTAEIRMFLSDFINDRERGDLNKRVLAAIMLAHNFSYHEIQRKTGLSSRTVAKTSFILSRRYGKWIKTLKRARIDIRR